MLRRFTKFFLFAFLFAATLYGQSLTVEAYGVSPRDVARSTTDIYTSASTGLTNVGVGTLNYIKVTMTGGTLGTVTWSATKRPSGSTTAVSTTFDAKGDNVQIFYFKPDKPGTYEFTAKTDVYSASVTFNSAKFVGYQNTVINGTDTHLSCGTCHSEYVAEWQQTNHATMFTRAMNATPGLSGPTDHYSKNCISCHTTGYFADSTAVNDGFDDLGFVYPAKVYPGTFDTLVTLYPDAMKRANIQCEACHGPASGHLGVTSDSRMTATFNADVCAWCHDSGTHHYFPEQWDASGHSITVDESGPGRESCVRCHTGKGFAQYADGIATTDPYFDPSYSPISCQSCHDPHSAEHEFQFRKVDATLLAANSTTITMDESNAGTGAICYNCHQSRTEANAAVNASSISSRFGPHHGPQGDVFIGNNMLELGGVTLQKSNHALATQDDCVTCHMFNGEPVSGTNINTWGGHSFAMYSIKRDANGDFPVDESGNRIREEDYMQACAQCHGNTFGTSFKQVTFTLNKMQDFDGDGVKEGLQDEVQGMIDRIYAAVPTGSPSKSWSKDQLSAYWNAKTAEEDRSLGIHNPKYVVTALLGAMKLMGIVTAVDDQVSEIPTEYTLAQNYPNPFNPSTNIRFSLPKASDVKLVVYDALGKEVTTIVNNRLDAGVHTYSWNASGLASGIYFYRIEADNFVKVNKMLLVK